MDDEEKPLKPTLKSKKVPEPKRSVLTPIPQTLRGLHDALTRNPALLVDEKTRSRMEEPRWSGKAKQWSKTGPTAQSGYADPIWDRRKH